MLVTYQKRNGEIIERKVKNHPPYRIGETTSMGWKLIDIKQFYKGKYYAIYEYDKLINRDFQKMKRKLKFKRKFILVYKQLAYSIFLLILFRVFENVMFYNFV